MIWLDRLPPILWSLNTSISATMGFSPFYLEHGREPRDIASRAMDTTEMPAISAKWAQVMQQRLGLPRKVQSAVETHAADDQARREALPKEAKRTRPPLLPGTYCYYQVQLLLLFLWSPHGELLPWARWPPAGGSAYGYGLAGSVLGA